MINKSAWPRGQWDDEPDVAIWTDKSTGLYCKILRREYSGCFAGYVAVPVGHPLHGTDYQDVEIDGVHGGLVFAGAMNDGSWLFGFDCQHDYDHQPRHQDHCHPNGSYCTFDYVKHHVEKLAQQLAAQRASK